MAFNNNQRTQGSSKEAAFNKVKFSSIKLGETKQGSPTMGLYLKREQLERFVSLAQELLQTGGDGCKLSCIVIPGKDYDSGYMYVNPKEARKEDSTNGQAQTGNKQAQAPASSFGNKNSARAFFNSKRVDDNTKN